MDKKEYSIIQNMLYILKGIWKYHRFLILLLVLSAVCGAFSQYIWLFLPKLVIDQIQHHASSRYFFTVMAAVLALQLILSGLNTYASYGMSWRFRYVGMKFKLKLNRIKNTMDYEFLENPEVLDRAQLADRGAASVEGMLRMMNAVAVQAAKILLSIAIILTLNPIFLGLVVFSSAAYYIVLNLTIKSDKKNCWDQLIPSFRRLWYSHFVNRNFEYAKDTKLYDMEEFLMAKEKKLNGEAHKLVLGSKLRWLKFGNFYNLLSLLLELALYAVLIYYALRKELSVANFTFYFATIKAFSSSLDSVLYSIAALQDHSRRISDYRTFTEYKKEKPDTGKSLKKIKSFRFDFEGVSFCYPGRTEYALKDLNLKLEDKSKLAVVGLNGAGKSTFIKLLLRLYEPTKGRILLDGTDIREFDRDEYYALFAPLFQTINLFAIPIGENISMKTPEQTDKGKAYQAAGLAGFGEKLESLPKGIDTQLLKFLYDDGIDLSGGEKQKLALSRAIYKEAPVIVLDEPTSSLDALAEYRLYKSFDEMIQGKTAVYISHRLSSTRFCDVIAMFDKGAMVEYGTHEELLSREGAYKRLFDIQARYYQEEKEDFEYAKG